MPEAPADFRVTDGDGAGAFSVVCPVVSKTPDHKIVEIAGYSERLEKIRCPYCMHVLLFARLGPGTAIEIKCRRCRRYLNMLMD